MLSAAKATEIKQPFFGARERHSHPIEKKNYRGGHLAHSLCRWLIRKKVSAVDRVIKVFPGGVAFALCVDGPVDSSLSTNRMRALYGHDRKKIHRMSRFGNSHCRRQTCQPATNDRDFDAVVRHL